MSFYYGKKVLITGASSGIGAAIAVEAARQGAEVHLLARNLERLDEVADRCRAEGAAVGVYSVDMASEASIDAFVAEVEQRGVQFDVMVLNAGISQRAKALETDLAVDRKIMEVDYFGPVMLTKKLSAQILSGRKISMAVTTSISGLFGFPLRSAYCAAKAALFGFFETIEIENPNVRVTFLIPGRINTPISRSAIHGDGTAHGVMDAGQANGMDVDKCATVALRAIARGRHRKLIGRGELAIVYVKKYFPWLFFKIAGRISAT